jgi:predicted O-methyltransferase YrrM
VTEAIWKPVDAWIGERLATTDDVLERCLRESEAAGLPAIAVSRAHGKMLHLIAKSIGARRVLEVGTLGGFSAIWMARALPADGRIVSLEIDRHNAEVARANLERAGVSSMVEIRIGAALDLLPELEGSFDMAFIDADKENNAAYFDHAVRLSRPGGVIIVDNVVRDGRVLEVPGNSQVQGVRAMMDAIYADARVSATAVQTVGEKGYDGFLMAVVN